MSVISIRFDSIRFVSFHLVSASQGGKERRREKTALRLGKVLCLDLLGLVVIEKVEFIINFFLLADMRLGFAVVVGCAVR